MLKITGREFRIGPKHRARYEVLISGRRYLLPPQPFLVLSRLAIARCSGKNDGWLDVSDLLCGPYHTQRIWHLNKQLRDQGLRRDIIEGRAPTHYRIRDGIPVQIDISAQGLFKDVQ